MPTIDSFGRDYLRLALEIDRHVPGYIDAYYGPAEVREDVQSSPPRAPRALLDDVNRLRDAVPQQDVARATWLAAALRAMETTIRLAAGETFDYLQEVYLLYDIHPALVPESLFEAAHRQLDGALPEQHGASLGDRLEMWRKQFVVPPDQALALLELARGETRQRTTAMVDLPAGESVELRLVSGQPWGAYNWFLGNGRSLIEFNTDIPLQATALLGTFAHEGYPGHHTEAILKEASLYHERGYVEPAAVLLHSPWAVTAEGIATTALDMIFPNGSHYDWNVEVLLPAAGLPAEPGLANRMRQIGAAAEAYRYVSANAAILYHTGQLDREGALDYLQTYGLATAERAAKSFSFFTHPLYRSYPFTYTVGHDLIAATPDPTATFHRLLTEQILPSQLAAARE